VLGGDVRLRLEDIWRVDAGQASVESILDSVAHAGSGLGGLLPVHRKDATEPCEELAGYLGNMLRLLFDPEGVRQVLENWEEVALATLERTHREALAEGPHGPAARILSEVLALPGVPRQFHRPRIAMPLALLVPLNLRRGELVVRLFSTITTLGTPADVTAQELRVESWFPADEASAAWVHAF
jgi:hypothetical protein